MFHHVNLKRLASVAKGKAAENGCKIEDEDTKKLQQTNTSYFSTS